MRIEEKEGKVVPLSEVGAGLRATTGMRSKITGSLRAKMTAVFGFIVLCGSLVLCLVSQNRAGSALEAEAREAMLKVAKQAADTVDSRMQARIYAVESLADNQVLRGKSGQGEATLEEKLQVLREGQKRAESLGFTKPFGLADKTGDSFVSDGTKVNVADREYFRVALGGKTVVSTNIVNKKDNSNIFAYATPVRHYATNEITGVLICPVDATQLSDLVKGIAYGRTGYAFVVDGTGKTIAHKDLDRVKFQENILEQAKSNPSLASLAEAISHMTRGEEGVANYTLEGQEYLIAYAPIQTTGWSIAVTAPRSEVLERVTDLRNLMFLISFLMILAALVVTSIMAKTISAPLVQAVDHLRSIAAGDFTRPVPEKFLRMKDEIGKFNQALVQLQDSIRPLLSGLIEYAKTLAGNAETLSAASEEITSSSGEVAKAIQQVASGASEQASHLQDILGLVENISASLERVYTELGRVRSNSEDTSRLAGIGKNELEALIASIEGVREAFKLVGERLKGLSGSVNQVGEILEVINGIAEQTNLLALNAAIEAARAGEAGRGFAVVADEVRKLAEQSRSSSDKIRSLLNSIASETDEVVHTSEEVGRHVAAQLQNVENTVKAFDNILEAVTAMAPMIEATYREVDNTVKAKDVVLDRVQSISAVAEETSASAEEISASAEELSASTQEIAANAQQVLEVAKRLEQQASRFKV